MTALPFDEIYSTTMASHEQDGAKRRVNHVTSAKALCGLCEDAKIGGDTYTSVDEAEFVRRGACMVAWAMMEEPSSVSDRNTGGKHPIGT